MPENTGLPNGGLPVVLTEAAIADMSGIGRWVARHAGFEIADAYLSRIQAACNRLGVFPNRGTPRFDAQAGLI